MRFEERKMNDRDIPAPELQRVVGNAKINRRDAMSAEKRWMAMMPCSSVPLLFSALIASLRFSVVKPRSFLEIQTLHQVELLSQLRLGGWKLGLLINFNTIRLKEGIRRVVLSQH